MIREVCEHGNWLESPCYYCQTKPPFSPVIAAKDARIAELEAVIRESIRNHRIGCPCPRCGVVGGVLGKTTNPAISIQTGI